MSRSNPRKAMAALIPPGQAVIRPMTLGVYAALERINSPLITGNDAKDTLELLPSLYILTHDPREVFRGNILDLAMQWADTQPIEAVVAIRDAALEEIRAMLDVTPEQDSDKPKKKRRVDRGMDRLGRERIRMVVLGDHVGSTGKLNRPPAEAGRATQGPAEVLPAPGNRGD